MCMENVTEAETIPKHAYKVCSKVTGDLFTGPYSQTRLRYGKWMKAQQEPSQKVPPPYKPGFHVFALKLDAERYRKELPLNRNYELFIVKVEIRSKAIAGVTYSYVTRVALPGYSVAEIKFLKDPL